MQNKITKIITIIIVFTLFLSTIDALEPGDRIKIDKDGDIWKVVKVDELGNKIAQCEIDKPTNPNKLHIVAKEFPTIGWTYENTCKSGHWVTTITYTMASTHKGIFGETFSPNKPAIGGQQVITNEIINEGGEDVQDFVDNVKGEYEDTTSAGEIPADGMSSNIEDTNLKLLSTYTKDKNLKPNYVNDLFINNLNDYSIKRMDSLDDIYGFAAINGYYAAEAAKLEKKGHFVSYWWGCFGTKTRTCEHTKTEVCNCVAVCDPDNNTECWTSCGTCTTTYTVEKKSERKETYNYPNIGNVDPSASTLESFKDTIDEPPECDAGGKDLGVTDDAYCTLPYYRAPIYSSKFICDDVGPTKVEVYGYDLSINGKDAYCVTPSAGYNKAYYWDNRFDASTCKNSLQMYNKDGSVSYNIDCGYAYIMAEGKRLNSEAGSEVFSYGAISTAMKLFGTGIVGNKDENGNQLYLSDLLDDAISNNKFLQSAGYYTTYYGWGYGEYVGIPWIRGDGINRSGWPGIYQYFMPEFYSIFIHTAEVAGSYLKQNIRFADVGNVKDSSGNYITDPFYYLNPKECSKTFKNCTTTSTKVQYNDPLSQGIVNSNFPMNDDLINWLQSDGLKTSCQDESGLGVLCGLKNEKGNAEYIKAIYLYIRALQGNELVFEQKIENSLDEYKPIDGLTKIIYEGDEEEIIIRYAIDTKITSESIDGEIEVDCDWTNEETKNQCKAQVFVFDADGHEVYHTDHYDYCKKNYCYVEVKSTMLCNSNQKNSRLTSVVVTNPGLKSTTIKKIVSGIKNEQTIFVYDDEGKINGGFCQEIEAVKENVSYKCPCDSKEQPNLVEATGNISGTNYCSKNYNAYDELFYGDPSISTIINACYEEDKLKYDFTDDLNANGNDIMYQAELESRYSFQKQSDDFGVCKLYCRDETRFYIGNKLSVKAGQNLRYDIGQTLIDKKIINETAKDKGNLDGKDRNTQHNYMPSVVLQLRECTSEIDYKKWETLYNKATTTKEKNQLLYSIYNCNLYTTEEIRQKITEGKLKNIINENPTTYQSLNGYAEPAMIEYKYNTSDGNITIVNNYGTTKDYLLAQEGCTSLGLNQTDCAAYFLNYYSDDYYNIDSPDNLGITLDFEHGLVNSNLNETIYCSGESCYKLKGKDGKYYYNPNAKNKNDYTTVDNIYDGSGNIVRYESGKILSYQEWGLNYKEYDKNSTNYITTKIDGNEVPKNEYASFIVVTETGFYNKQKYYSDSYSGIIRNEPNQDATIKSVELDKNIFPLHLDKQTGTYEISHTFNSIRTAYKRSTYYTEKNYSLFDKIDNKPGTVNFICEYDVYNTTTKYECESGNCKRELGFIYRAVDLNDVFESVTNESRQYPENWATSFAQTTLNQIQASSQNILEQDKNNDDNDSYLEYSYTLTPDGIKRIKEYNKTKLIDGGYLDTSTYGCQYDEEEGIFYNCKSKFLLELESLNGKYDGLITVNKNDGVSEFCSNTHNEDKDYCKYQQKYETIDLSGGE